MTGTIAPFDHPLPATAIRQLTRGLETEKVELQAFAAAMEREFMDIGGSLRSIVTLSREVRHRCDEIVVSAAGRSEDAAIQFAFQLLKKAEDLVFASREMYARVFTVFEAMQSDFTSIDRERTFLIWTLFPLDSIATQFRVQSCVFDESIRHQFFALSGNIAGIAHEVRTAVQERFDELERTGQATQSLITNLSALAGRQKIETQRMLVETRENLSALNQALRSSEASAQSIADSGARIGGGVSQAIVALQCQDMARQKLEHINAAIDDMIGHLAMGAEHGFDGAEAASCRRFLAGASRLQLGQLTSVFGQLDHAAQEIGAGLGQVESEALLVSANALESGAATLDGQVIGRVIHSIHAVLGVIETAVGTVRTVGELVRKLKSTFYDCTSQILDLALNLRIVALNAQIVAAQVDTGAVLEVIASSTRVIADEAKTQLDALSSHITTLVDDVVDLEARLDGYRDLAAIEQSVLTAEADQAEQRLLSLESELLRGIAAVSALDGSLSAVIQSTTSSIRFPETVAQASARALAFFRQLVFDHSATAGDAEPVECLRLENLKLNYTMAQERVIHNAAVAPLACVDVEEDLAANVELF